MRPAHRPARPALLVSAVLLLSACGIPATGVVESGAPATGVRPPTLVYFVSNGTPVPALRRADTLVGVVAAVRMLLRGPDPSELKAGLTSAIPPVKSDPRIWTEGSKVSILMPEYVRPLSEVAFRQLVCTAVSARHTEAPDIGSVEVIVMTSLGSVGPRRAEETSESCSRGLGPASAAAPVQTAQ
jgi:hypothetical protein